MKKILFVLLLTLSFSFLACTKEQPKNENKNKRIAIIPKGAAHEFWKSIHAGAVKASKEIGLDIIWKAPSKEADREEQIKIVEDFINSNVSGIVISPADNMALRLPVREAVSAGIPVIVVDSELKSDDYLSFVATDNYKGGVMAARELARQINNKGKVIMLRYQEGQESVMKRENGFMDTMREEFKDIEVVSSNQYSGVTTESAYKASENLLATFKSDDQLSIDGIFAPCEPVVFGMLRALEDMQLAGSVKLVGFDSTDKLVEGLKKNYISALVLQDPVGMAYQSVKLMKSHLDGNKIEKRIDTGVYIATKENMNDKRIARLLKPEIDKWLN